MSTRGKNLARAEDRTPSPSSEGTDDDVLRARLRELDAIKKARATRGREDDKGVPEENQEVEEDETQEMMEEDETQDVDDDEIDGEEFKEPTQPQRKRVTFFSQPYFASPIDSSRSNAQSMRRTPTRMPRHYPGKRAQRSHPANGVRETGF